MKTPMFEADDSVTGDTIAVMPAHGPHFCVHILGRKKDSALSDATSIMLDLTQVRELRAVLDAADDLLLTRMSSTARKDSNVRNSHKA